MSGSVIGMTPAEHYKAAQLNLQTAWQATVDPDGKPDEITVLAAIAHALLAIAGQLTPLRVEQRR